MDEIAKELEWRLAHQATMSQADAIDYEIQFIQPLRARLPAADPEPVEPPPPEQEPTEPTGE